MFHQCVIPANGGIASARMGRDEEEPKEITAGLELLGSLGIVLFPDGFGEMEEIIPAMTRIDANSPMPIFV